MLSIRSWMFACLGVVAGDCRTTVSARGSGLEVSAGDGPGGVGRGWTSGADEGRDSAGVGVTAGADLGRLGRLRGGSSAAGWGAAGGPSLGSGSAGRSWPAAIARSPISRLRLISCSLRESSCLQAGSSVLSPSEGPVKSIGINPTCASSPSACRVDSGSGCPDATANPHSGHIPESLISPLPHFGQNIELALAITPGWQRGRGVWGPAPNVTSIAHGTAPVVLVYWQGVQPASASAKTSFDTGSDGDRGRWCLPGSQLLRALDCGLCCRGDTDSEGTAWDGSSYPPAPARKAAGRLFQQSRPTRTTPGDCSDA